MMSAYVVYVFMLKVLRNKGYVLSGACIYIQIIKWGGWWMDDLCMESDHVRTVAHLTRKTEV